MSNRWNWRSLARIAAAWLLLAGQAGAAGPAVVQAPYSPAGQPLDLGLTHGRSLASRASDVVNVKDAPYSAAGDGVTDDTQSIQNAANAVPSCAQGGGVLYFPSSTAYLIRPRTINTGGGVVLNNCTSVQGDGIGSRIVSDYNAPVFLNNARNISPTAFAALATATPGNQLDHDISISKLNFDISNLTNYSSAGQGPPVAASFLLGYNFLFQDNLVTAGTTYPGTAAQFVGTDNSRAIRNTVINAYVGVDSWKGNSRLWIEENSILMAPNPANATNHECINVNARGTLGSDNEITRDFHVLHNSCRLNGYAQAMSIDTLGAASQVNDGEITGNTFDCSTAAASYNLMILGRGSINRVTIRDNKVIGCSSSGNNTSIALFGQQFGSVSSLTNPITANSGSSLFTLALPNHNTGTGAFVKISAASAVGGVTLSGYYKVTSVTDANTLVVQGPAAASSTATGGGTTPVSTYYGLPYGIDFSDNFFLGTNTGSAPLLTLNMGGSVVANNNQLGAANFQVFALVDYYDPALGNLPTLVKDNLTQQAGSVASGSTFTNNGTVYPVSGNVAFNPSLPLASSVAGELNYFASGIDLPTSTKSNAYTLVSSDNMINVNASSAALTMTLPSCATINRGREYTVKKIDSSANAVTVSVTGSDTIDGASSLSLASQWVKATVRCDGSAHWYTK